MADIPASNENSHRRAIRLAVGILPAFLINQFFPWPIGFLAPVVAAVLLFEAKPLGIRDGLRQFRTVVFFLTLGWLVNWLLTPWPVVLVLVVLGLQFSAFMFMLTSGAPIVEIVGALIGFTVIPVVTVLMPELGLIALVGFLLSFAAGFLCTWIAWMLVPLNQPPPEDHHAEPLSREDAVPVATTLTIIGGSLMVLFWLMSWTSVLVLVYGVLFATAYSSLGGRQMGTAYVIANAVYGGVAMLISYELIVMAPTIPFMAALVFFVVFLFGSRIFSGGPTAGFWNSGLFGFLIMLGGLLTSDKVSTITLATRLWQLVLGTVYVTFAFAVVEWIWSLKQEKQPLEEGDSNGQIETG